MTENGAKAQLHRYKLIGVAVAVLLSLALILGLHSGKVCTVIVNGKIIAYAENESAVNKTIETLAAQKTKQLDQEVTPEAGIELKTVKSAKTPLNEKDLTQVLADKVNFVTKGTVVEIDGKPQLTFNNRQTTDKFFNQLKEKYTTGENCELSFEENINITDKQVNIKNLDTIENALHLAENGKGEPEIHIVSEGDTLWDLARDNDLTVEQLDKLNPGVTENLQLGQEIKVSGSAPLFTVLSSYEITEKEIIPFTTIYRQDSSMALGTTKSVQEGRQGAKNVTYQVLAENGRITEKTEIKKEILEESVSRIVKKGTKFVLSSRGGGLIWPVAGSITSRYGSRWGGTHSGIDIASSYGTSIRAAGPGRVTTAGWGGGYGRTVVVSHGNGIYTRYAHMSSIAVSTGQYVDRGQFIGRVGTSGNSTGPHLHFEVVRNGVTSDPLRFL
ncbi:MAG: LysM peptidoglycan-binding domain-containing protein [Firmicutes bacterium]|nr:LysM peptidoglycan-binding domain-containing protein [Bacillota bacterium]